jgi:hypothetical protein
MDPLQTNFRAYLEILANKHSKKLGTLICSTPARTVRPTGADCPDRGSSDLSFWCPTHPKKTRANLTNVGYKP